MADYGDVWYESSDGLRLYARDYACSDRSLAQPPVLLCMHGLTRNSADFHGLARYLQPRCRVIAVDVRGRGRSEYDSQPANYTPATYVQDMLALLQHLQLQQVILVGTSMGGLMAFIMAAMSPDRVSALVINDIGPEVDPRGLARIKAYVGKSDPVRSWEEALAQTREINRIAFPDFTEAQWQEFVRGLYHEENGVPVLSYDPAIAQPVEADEGSAVPPDLWPLFEACCDKPMLVVRGETSDILAPSCIDRMRSLHPALRVAIIPGRGHAPTLTEPAAIEAIDGFLQEL